MNTIEEEIEKLTAFARERGETPRQFLLRLLLLPSGFG
jgi:hypothetical protein